MGRYGIQNAQSISVRKEKGYFYHFSLRKKGRLSTEESRLIGLVMGS